MRVLVCVASHEVQLVGAIRTAYLLKRREGDEFADQWRRRGDVTREEFVEHFLKDEKYGPEDAILLLDGDQRHPADMLEQLRESADQFNLDMVCAHYYARQTNNIQSLCFPIGDGTWPMIPYLNPPTEGLHELGWTGFGCVLIRKKVLQAVAKELPNGMSPVAIAPLPEVSKDHANFGPDFRFFWLARKAGYKLWLKADVESLHAVTLWLGHKSARKLVDYTRWANALLELIEIRMELHGMTPEVFKQRHRLLDARKQGLLQQMQELVQNGEQEKAQEISMALYIMDGRILECQAWINMLEKYPRTELPQELPTTENTPKQETIDAEGLKERQAAYQTNALEFVQALPDVPANGGYSQQHGQHE